MAPVIKHERIAAIIAAYNEANRIQGVLAVLAQVGLLDEILVVDDGSQDSTSAEILAAGAIDTRVRLLRHDKNRGKGQAIYTAWSHARANILLLLDADLVGLKPDQVRDLLQPVLENRADMTLGLFRGGHFNTDLAHLVTPWLSGQRCLRSELFWDVSRSAAQGYGLEAAITVAALIYGWRVQPVRLRGVTHPPSELHRGFWWGVANRARMYAQVLRAWYVAGGMQVFNSRFCEGKRSRLARVLNSKDYHHVGSFRRNWNR